MCVHCQSMQVRPQRMKVHLVFALNLNLVHSSPHGLEVEVHVVGKVDAGASTQHHLKL